MSRILAIDSASEVCSVALTGTGEPLLLSGSGRRQHARQLLPLIEELLARGGVALHELDALAIVQGPGSFTGLRIGAGIAQGLAFSAALPVVCISSMALMAAAAHQRHPGRPMLVCLQARAEEFYWASYRPHDGRPRLCGREQAGPARDVAPDDDAWRDDPDAVWLGVGDAWHSDALRPVAEACGLELQPDVSTDAAMLAQLALPALADGEAVAAEQAVPVYIKEELDYRRHRGS